MNHFDFRGLFILEIANNHQGDVEHGRRIIREMSTIARANKIKVAVKFQFRDLDTFIHPAHREKSDNKHVPRFLSTRLSKDQFRALVEECHREGLLSMCTPFDEPSVEQIAELGINLTKIGSCSANDWPLLEKVAEFDNPVVISTGGLSLKQIDDVVSFFDHRRVHHAIQHCVAIYPTPDDLAHLNQIDILKRRYPDKVVGFSTHEAPDNCETVLVAVAKGAETLERHVGVATDKYKLNTYSSSPEQVDRWVKAALRGRALCGSPKEQASPKEEQDSLDGLKRGIFARRPLRPGTTLVRDDVYFALPVISNGFFSGEWKEGITITAAVEKDQGLSPEFAILPGNPEKKVLFTAIHTIKGILNEARIVLSPDFQAEFSHHYGLARFPEVGATLIECMNRDYCKKLIIQTAGQRHPNHYHKRKEETFQVLWGTLKVDVEGRPRTLFPGDTLLVQQGVWHSFWTDEGVVFEEISTRHYNDDSFYEDKVINTVPRPSRKTVVNHWGRYQI